LMFMAICTIKSRILTSFTPLLTVLSFQYLI